MCGVKYIKGLFLPPYMETILEKIGLTPTESKVYMALLELGEAKTGEILKKAHLNSGRIYEVLASLEKKGLVSSVIKRKVKLFIPSPPERVLDYLNGQMKDIEEKKRSFDGILQSLNAKFKQLKQKTSVEVFFGIEGLKTAYSIFFKEAEHDKNLYIHGIVSKEKYSRDIIDTLIYYVYKKRIELKLSIKKLISEEAKGDKIFSLDKSSIKYLPYPSMTSMEMLGDITLVQFFENPVIVILINNKKITQDYKKQFEFLWKMAKE